MIETKIIPIPALCCEPHGPVEMLLVPGEWLTAVEDMLRRDEVKYHWMTSDMRLHYVAREYLLATLRAALIEDGIVKGKAQS